jgi:N-acetylmuramoyl-L-alanine amidase
MKVDNHRLKLDSGKFAPFVTTDQMGGQLQVGKPRILVIHYTAGGSAAGAISTFRNGKPGNRTSAHLVIDHDGKITQMVPFDMTGWHAGPSRWRGLNNINSHSVGIEVVNWGKLSRMASGGWSSDYGHSVPADRVVLASHKHFPGAEHGWELFDEAQIEALIGAAGAIVHAYGIGGWDLVGHDDIAPFRKIDPGPALRLDMIRARVFGREDDAFDDRLFKVNTPGDGLNLRERPAIADSRVIKKLPHGALVHVIERVGAWALVAQVISGADDVTGFVHGNWLIPA